MISHLGIIPIGLLVNSGFSCVANFPHLASVFSHPWAVSARRRGAMAGTMAVEEGKPLVTEKPAAPTNSCCGCCPAPRHMDDAFVDKYLDGDVQWGYWKMPPRNPATLEEQRMRLIDREAFPVTSIVKWPTKMERGFASAKDMIDILYKATLAPGITDKVPEHLRGVYWMKDNGVGEELVVIQWSQWYEEAA
eukprot:s1224_g4.t1